MASVERQFGAGTLATVSYVGASSHHLLVLEEANPADPALCLSLGSACGPFNEQAARTALRPGIRQRRVAAHHRQRQLQRARSHAEPSLARPGFAGQLHVVEVDRSIGGIAGARESRRSLAEPRPLVLRHAAQLRRELPLRVPRAALQKACSMQWSTAGPWPGLRALPRGCRSRCSTTTTHRCWAPFPTASTTTAWIRRSGAAQSLHLNTNPRGGGGGLRCVSSSRCPRWEPWATRGGGSFPGPGWRTLTRRSRASFLVQRQSRAGIPRRGLQRLQPRAVLRRRRGGGEYFKRQLRPGGERHGAAADAGGAAVPVLEWQLERGNRASLWFQVRGIPHLRIEMWGTPGG